MPHKPEHKALVASIIDQEVEAAALAREVYESSKKSSERIKFLMRRVVDLRARGKLTAKRAKELVREGFVALTLVEYVRALPAIQKTVDTHAEEQVKAIAQLKRPLREVGPIRNADIKERELEKAGVLNEAGKVDGN